MKKPKNDLTGKRFGRLYVIGVVDDGSRKTYYECQCDCGKIKKVRSDSLVCGAIRSCGCLKKEQDIINLSQTTHGLSQTKIYKIWQGMKKRCELHNDKRYSDYGGRGIKVCEEWHDFINFYNWAIQNGYSEDLTIDRIDNNGNYEPSNCRWSTNKEQANNRRTNINITIGNTTKTMTEWCDIFNLEYNVVNARYHRNDNITLDDLFRAQNG